MLNTCDFVYFFLSDCICACSLNSQGKINAERGNHKGFFIKKPHSLPSPLKIKKKRNLRSPKDRRIQDNSHLSLAPGKEGWDDLELVSTDLSSVYRKKEN